MSVLERIVARTRQDLAARKATRPLAALRAQAGRAERSLSKALAAPHTGFVMECKKASPSRGLIREDFNAGELAVSYAAAADAISVLTDAPFFQGSHAFLGQVAGAVALPVLCKDFIVEPYQVVEARAHGADAVLLMLSVLDDAGWRACYEAVQALGMDALTEVHDDAELARAVALGAPVIGINNRDLRSLEIDLATTEQLAPRVPPGRLVLCESGIASHADVRRLRALCDGFLVGTSLASRPDVERAVRELVYGAVKVCGLTRPEDAAAAWTAGATWGGLIFAHESPRCVSPGQARRVREAASQLRWAGVFVDTAPAQIGELARALALDAVQLHGDDPPERVAAVRAALPPGCELWKVLRVRGDEAALPEPQALGATRLLLDTFSAARRGGTGERFDWRLVARLRARARERLVLSGGLAPDNAAAADALGCAMLDVNSGVESAPGHKSRARLAAFFAALRGDARRSPQDANPSHDSTSQNRETRR